MIKAGFRCPVRARIRDNLWVKLWGNLSFNMICSLTMASLDVVVADKGTRAVARTMMLEAQAVGEKIGVEFPLDVDARIAGAAEVGAHKPSTLIDLERGRPMEIDALLVAPLDEAELPGLAPSAYVAEWKWGGIRVQLSLHAYSGDPARSVWAQKLLVFRAAGTTPNHNPRIDHVEVTRDGVPYDRLEPGGELFIPDAGEFRWRACFDARDDQALVDLNQPPGCSGRGYHAEIKIGDSVLMMGGGGAEVAHGRGGLLPAGGEGRPGGAGRLLQHGAGVFVQGAEQLGEARVDRAGVGRPAGVEVAQERGVRAAESRGQDVDARHRGCSLCAVQGQPVLAGPRP